MCAPQITNVLSSFITQDNGFQHLLNIQRLAVAEFYQQLRAFEILLIDVSRDEQVSEVLQRISEAIRRLQETDRHISAAMEVAAARQIDESYESN